MSVKKGAVPAKARSHSDPGSRTCDPNLLLAWSLLGRPWSGPIVHLLTVRALRFSELRSALPEITDRMLARRLDDLCRLQLIKRVVHAGPPVSVSYTLSVRRPALEKAFAYLALFGAEMRKRKIG